MKQLCSFRLFMRSPYDRGSAAASPFLIGFVLTLITQGGIAAAAEWLRARYALGDSPTSSVKRELNEPSEVQPTAKHASVTDTSPRLNRVLARSILRVIR